MDGSNNLFGTTFLGGSGATNHRVRADARRRPLERCLDQNRPLQFLLDQRDQMPGRRRTHRNHHGRSRQPFRYGGKWRQRRGHRWQRRGFELTNGSCTESSTATFWCNTVRSIISVTCRVAPTALNPNGDIIMDSSGNLFGTTYAGSSAVVTGSAGTLKQAGSTETVLYTFCTSSCSDGSAPFAGAILDSSGNLYGTTSGGGASSGGVL